jgi:hypothetical protein
VTASFLATATTAQAVVVAVSHIKLTVPPQPATPWILALAGDDPVGSVLPGMLSERDDERLWNLVSSGKADSKDLHKAFCSAVAEASGRPWWVALKLVGMCDGSPEFIGRLTLKGVDPDRIPFARWCAAVYALAMANADEKARMKFDAKLDAPPAGVEFEDEGMSFESMVAQARSIPGMRVG